MDDIYWTILDWSINLFFFMDIIINFITPIINDRGEVKTDLKTIRKHYLKGWFYIDVIASIPLELINLFFSNTSSK